MVTVRLVARLTDASENPLRGKPIWFYYEMEGTWIHIATAVTNDDGYASVEYEASKRTVFKAEFRGDEHYEPASATAVWDPSGRQTEQQNRCQPVVKTGVGVLDMVLFCIGSYGITFLIIIVAAFVLWLLLRMK
jgi:hypothetical protein